MTRTDTMPMSWADAACANVPADWFHPERGESTRDAKTVCATCPVRLPCLIWALDNHEKFGIWGGTSERERRRIRLRLAAGQAIPELESDWAPLIRRASLTPTAPLPAPEEDRHVELTVAPITEPVMTNGGRPTDLKTGLPTDACVNCGTRYTPVRKDQRFHAKECARAWYAAHPRGESGGGQPIRKRRAARTAATTTTPATTPSAQPVIAPTSTPTTPADGTVDLQALLGQLLTGCHRWHVEVDLGDIHLTISRGDGGEGDR